MRIRAAFAVALLTTTQLSCSEKVVAPSQPPTDQLPFEWSFEQDGQPTLEGWRIGNPSLTTLVREPAPGGGEWSLGLAADWAPTTGFIFRPMLGVRNGDILQLSAFVRAFGQSGGGFIVLSVGPDSRQGRGKWAGSASTSWTQLSVQDTVSLAPGDTVWVTLSSPNTEVAARQGRFDLVELRRIGSVTPTQRQHRVRVAFP